MDVVGNPSQNTLYGHNKDSYDFSQVRVMGQIFISDIPTLFFRLVLKHI